MPSLDGSNEVTNIEEPNQGITYYFDPSDNSGSHYSTTTWHNSLSWGPGQKSVSSSNKYLLKSTATALGSGTSDSVASTEWSEPIIVAQFSSGQTGAAGKRLSLIHI